MMKRTLCALAVLMAVSGAPAVAEEQGCIQDGILLQGLHLVRQPGEGLPVEPGQSFDYVPHMEALKLDLKKPAVPNFDAEFSLRINSNLQQGAGYSSPYLWEVGQGPGLRRGMYTLTPMHPAYMGR